VRYFLLALQTRNRDLSILCGGIIDYIKRVFIKCHTALRGISHESCSDLSRSCIWNAKSKIWRPFDPPPAPPHGGNAGGRRWGWRRDLWISRAHRPRRCGTVGGGRRGAKRLVWIIPGAFRHSQKNSRGADYVLYRTNDYVSLLYIHRSKISPIYNNMYMRKLSIGT